MAIVTMRYWAAAKAAAGIAEETVTADTLAGALAVIGGDDPDHRSGTGHRPAAGRAGLAAVLSRSSFLINGSPVGTRGAEAVELADGAVIEVLPPFAGG
jgi:molybdopterin synthase sulfur carrier subunit